MANYQQLQIEANRIIRGTHFYRYSESSYFAHEIEMLRQGIEDDRLKEYLKGQSSEQQKKIIEEAIKIAEVDSDLCRGLSVLLEYRCYDKALKIIMNRKEELDKSFYGTLLDRQVSFQSGARSQRKRNSLFV